MDTMHPDVPTVTRGTRFRLGDLSLTFITVVQSPGDMVTVIALEGAGPIAHLAWDTADGEVGLVHVLPGFRRNGVATLLWKAAAEVADAHGFSPPRHSAVRSPEGDLWARSVGGEVPEMTGEWDGMPAGWQED